MRKAPFFLLCIFLLAFSLFILFRARPGRNFNTQDEQGTTYLELWQVDTFEGGTGSRTSFVQSVSRDYAKQSNVKVIVKSQTPLSCEQNFKNGIYPDLISYGNGLKLPYGELIQFNAKNTEDAQSIYAKAWCHGGYVLISRKNVACDGVIISTQENTIPLIAYNLSNLKYNIFCQEESTNAIYTFYSNQNKALLGTQRDLYRLLNKGLDLQIQPLCEYSDLYQYISILCPDESKINSARAFIDYLTSEEVAGKLYKIGMLPCKAEYSLKFEYPLDVYAKVSWEYTTECLLPPEKLKKLQEMAQKYQQNSESIKNALKRLK